MALGDLTSGINMLPNDAMQQGFQNYLKSQSNIAQMKGQEAAKNINTVDQLLNVNLKGLQSKDMDEGVAARDNLVKQVAKWTAQDGPGGLSWEHQKQALALKDQLENMAQQSKGAQQLYNTRFQQIMGMKDKNAQQQAFKNLNQAYNMPTIEQRYNALNNPDLIPAPTYSLRDMAKNEYHLVTPEPTPQNIKDLTTQFNGNLSDEGSITSQKVQDLVKTGVPVEQAKQQVFNNLKSQLLGGQTTYGKAYSTALAKQQAKKGTELPTITMPTGTNEADASVKGNPNLSITIGGDTYQGGSPVRFIRKNNGEYALRLSYNIPAKDKKKINAFAQQNAGFNINLGDGGKVTKSGVYKGTIDVPISEYRNFINQNYNVKEMPSDFQQQLNSPFVDKQTTPLVVNPSNPNINTQGSKDTNL